MLVFWDSAEILPCMCAADSISLQCFNSGIAVLQVLGTDVACGCGCHLCMHGKIRHQGPRLTHHVGGNAEGGNGAMHPLPVIRFSLGYGKGGAPARRHMVV